MCGIFGAAGHGNVIPQLMRGLADLEYRGYDSAGLGALMDGRIVRRRVEGALTRLAALLAAEPLEARTAIGHTRWATHGAPLRHNAHPHATARVAVVHNGIIENHAALRAELTLGGAVFRSETDSEVAAWLVDRQLERGVTPLEAVRAATARLTGSYALVFVFAGHGNMLIATRRGSPLAIAQSERGSFVASDPDALARVAQEAVLLRDGDLAELRPQRVRVFDANLEERVTSALRLSCAGAELDRGAHSTYTHKEIHEQPGILERALGELRADLAEGRAERWCGSLWRASRVTAVACGTSYYAAFVARSWFEHIAGLPMELELGSELHARAPLSSPGTHALLVSQSGETADTLGALRTLKARGIPTVALVNVATSSMAREADAMLACRAGREVGVASTKAFTAQLFSLAAAAVAVRHARGLGTPEELDHLLSSLSNVPEAVRGALELEHTCVELGRTLAKASQVLYLGRGAGHPLALEGALKLKELSYVHAEGFAAGELKHGPLALVDAGTPVIVLAPSDTHIDKTFSNVREVLARGAEPVLIGDPSAAARAQSEGIRSIAVPAVDPVWAPIVMAIPLQLMAYHAACAAGRDVDRPRNLAKSVTVE